MTTTVYRPSTSSTGNVDITGDISASGTLNTVGISSAANATAINIDSSENVCIGTVTPDGTLHVHTATAGAITANANADDLVVENSGSGGISILTPDANSASLYFGSPSDSVAALVQWNHNNDLMGIGTANSGGAIAFYASNQSEAMRISSNLRLGLGISVPAAKAHIDQTGATAAIPVLMLDQADVSEEFIRFDAVEATGNSVEDVGAKTLTTTKFIRININGSDLYLQAGTIA